MKVCSVLYRINAKCLSHHCDFAAKIIKKEITEISGAIDSIFNNFSNVLLKLAMPKPSLLPLKPEDHIFSTRLSFTHLTLTNIYFDSP